MKPVHIPGPVDPRGETGIRRWLSWRPSADTSWALLEQAVGLVASALTFLLLGRSLGVAGFGAYVGLYALIGPFLAPSLSGIALAAMEHIVRESEDPVDVARSCLGLAVLIAVVCVPVLSLASMAWIAGIPAVAAVLFVFTEFCLNGVFATSQAIVQALTGFPAVVRFRLASTLSKIVLLSGLAATGNLTLTSLAIGQFFILGTIMAFGVTRISTLLGVRVTPGRIRRRHVRSVLLYGVGIGASSAQGDGDKFVLNAAHHQADAGRYGAAYRLMSIALLPANALLSATHLSFLNAAEGAEAHLRRAMRLAAIALAYAVPAAIGLVVVAPLIPLILNKDFSGSTRILQLLAPVVILRAIGGFPMNALMGLGRNGLRTKLLVANSAFSIVLYVALIPTYSWKGALAATLVSEFTLCAAGWIALLLSERTRRARLDPLGPHLGK